MDGETYSQLAAARKLQVAPVTLVKMVEAGYLTERRLPFARPRYLKSEVDALTAKYTRPATHQLVEA